MRAPNYARPVIDAETRTRLQKPAPRRLVKQAKQATVKTTDDAARKACHVRSGGRCEVMEAITPLFVFDPKTMKQKPVQLMAVRCKRRVAENHHLIGGSGRRNKGRSILAAHRLDCCTRCHNDITGKVLVPIVSQTDAELAARVVYERIKLPKKQRPQAEPNP